MSNETVVFALFLGAPGLLAFIITLGDWRASFKAILLWYGILLAGFFLMSWDIEDTLHGTLLYGMFFSVIAVPVLALILKLVKR